MSDAPIDEIREVTRQIEMMLSEHGISYDVAVSAMCLAMKHIAHYGWGLDETAPSHLCDRQLQCRRALVLTSGDA
jgi:hypothetical protein